MEGRKIRSSFVSDYPSLSRLWLSTKEVEERDRGRTFLQKKGVSLLLLFTSFHRSFKIGRK
jgi:hypothetical protein